MTKEVEVIIKPDGSSLAVSVLNSGMLEMGARVPRESDDVKEEILYQVAVIHQDMVSQRDELGRELLKLRQERDEHLDHLKQICEILGEVHDGKHDIGVAWESVAAIKHQRDELADQCENLATAAAMAVGALPDKSPIAAVCVAAVRKYNHTGGPDFQRVFDANLAEVRVQAIEGIIDTLRDPKLLGGTHLIGVSGLQEHIDRIRKEVQ